jgi:hypothetical protein
MQMLITLKWRHEHANYAQLDFLVKRYSMGKLNSLMI